MKNIWNKNNSAAISKEVLHPSLHLSIIVNGHYPPHKVLLYCVSYSQKYIHTYIIYIYIIIYSYIYIIIYSYI